jgi:thioredoxin 1
VSKELTTDTFDTTISKSGVVVVDFYAVWCGPCKIYYPVLEKVAQELSIPLYKLNIETEPTIAQRYGMRSVPTTIIFKDGILKATVIGSRPAHEIKTILEAAMKETKE